MPSKVCYITGASRGLGLAVARALEGKYRLGLGYRRNLPPALAHSLPVQADLSIASEASAAVELVRESFGRIDLVIANAAVTKDGLLARMSEDDWNQVIDTNLNGTFYTLRAAASALAETNGMAILVSSIIGRRGGAGSVNYAASKAGLIGMAHTLAVEWAPDIRVNVVVPGYMETDMGKESPELLERSRREHPLGVSTPVEDAARLIASVAELDTVTGQIFTADGRATRWF